MNVFSKMMSVALVGLIGLSVSSFAGTPKQEAEALATAIGTGASKSEIATLVKNAINGAASAADKAAMAQALIAKGGTDSGLLSTIASAAIAAAGRTGADAQAVAGALIRGIGADNAKIKTVAAAIKLSAGPGAAGQAVVDAAITAATAIGAGDAARAGSSNVAGTLGDNLQSTADASVGSFTDNSGALAEEATKTTPPPTAVVLIRAAEYSNI